MVVDRTAGHTPGSEVQSVLAANLRRLRIARQLSLSELARTTGIGKATLSGIENGRANPTVETVAGLAVALRISLVELLQEAPLGEVRILRAAQRSSGQPDGTPLRLLDSIPPDGGLQFAEVALGAHELQICDAKANGSRAHVYVLQGKLITGPVERPTELAPGDYASFPADVPHAYEAVRHPARALVLT
jgi:transcriptional regulator with XRE-family HTH domain